jgi:DNA-binding transcriptional MerR regulator
MSDGEDEYLPTRHLRARYKVTSKTIREWELAGVLPPPDWIGGRKYWRRSTLEEAERTGMSRRRSEVEASP